MLIFQPIKSTVNHCVFFRFYFFNMFMILMTSGTSWDLILDTFGGLETPFWWFLGVLDMHWNFMDFQDHPKLREPRCWRVNCVSRGPYNQQVQDWLTSDLMKSLDWWPVWYRFDQKTFDLWLQPCASQPDGPWQAGAGGFPQIRCPFFWKQIPKWFRPQMFPEVYLSMGSGGAEPPQDSIPNVENQYMCLNNYGN